MKMKKIRNLVISILCLALIVSGMSAMVLFAGAETEGGTVRAASGTPSFTAGSATTGAGATVPNTGNGSEVKTSMNIYAIDLGTLKGDATLIESDGEYLLIDTGSIDNKHRVVKFLKSKGVKKLSVLLTHFHADHAGGLMDVLENFNVQKLYVQQRTVLQTSVKEIAKAKDIKKAEKKSVKGMLSRYDALVVKAKKYTEGMYGFDMVQLKKGDSFQFGSAKADILGPVKLFHLSNMKKRKYDTTESRGGRLLNNNSLVLRVTSGPVRFLCCGDLEFEGENAMIKAKADLKADIFKMNHHGTDTSNSAKFLKRVRPKYSWSSYYCDAPEFKKQNKVYKKNKLKIRANTKNARKTVYGFIRTYDNITRADKYGEVYRTQFNGNIAFHVEGESIKDECKTGFRTVDGATYLYVNNKLKKGIIRGINMSFYKTDADGKIQTGLFKYKGKYYYCFGTHGMAMMNQGLIKYKGKKYCTNAYVPYLVTGWKMVGKKRCYFSPKTAVLTKK